MYLKRLDVQGYKSFANRTEFAFNNGITAIVGPNGSGKSNIADAVRWALGEQSYSVLRAKKTEDLIFSGSSQRAKVGLAEVSLILDNSSHWLPLDFGEVSITRRAYRSGENEYLLNGNRVRLRDINELLARGGLGRSSSVVIGQGQVDAALSLRPEERRSLFEEAAGVRVYIDKREESLGRLEETHRNLERLNDILAEISPRVESLRRQAERAREHELVEHDLQASLLLWYGYQWQHHQDRLARAEEQQQALLARVEQQREAVHRLATERQSLRDRQQALRDAIRQHRQTAEQGRARYEDLRRRMAVSEERTRALAKQHDQVETDLAGVNTRRMEAEAALARQSQELVTLEATIAEQQASATLARTQLNLAEAALRTQAEELERARAAAFDAAAAQSAARNRQAQLLRRQADVEHDLAEQQKALSDIGARVEAAHRDLATAETERQTTADALNGVEQELRQAEDQLAEALSRLDQLRPLRDAAREKHQRLATQFDVLQRARSQASYLHEGTQAVIREQMPGVLGTVASLFVVPAEFEVSIEAVLGGQLQDVVVKTWNDALACIDLLKRRDRGRATFLPLDYVRAMPPIPAPRVPGVRGIAARLVKADAAYNNVCELLLGNIVVVDDLPAGRKALAAESRLRRAVTLEGDIVEARGVVHGGSRPRNRGMLAQEREWRELPARVTAAEEELRKADEQVRAEDARQQELRARARSCNQRAQGLRSTLSQQDQRIGSLRQRYDRQQQEDTWRRSLTSQAQRTLETLSVDLAQAQGELASLEERAVASTRRVEEKRAELEQSDLQASRQQVATFETDLAVAQRGRLTQAQAIVTFKENLARAAAEAQSRAQQLEQIQRDIVALQQERTLTAQELADTQQALENLVAPLTQAETELQQVEKEQVSAETQEERARQQLQGLQTDQNRLTFERQRIVDDVEEVKTQMEAELGPVDLPDVGQPKQLRLNLGSGVTPLPKVLQLPDGLTAELKELRARLRRLGPVNPTAPQEFDEVNQRHQFLSEQIEDLNRAAEATREIVTELNDIIRERFVQTFNRVGKEFGECFGILFQGGSAKLILTEPDNPADSGIEIIARPPGKRSQSLSLLSGGERALTAAALLFALLRVNPMPFCVLDEVDAALDEANVYRFRDLLEELGRQTQFIVITHNRRTVEAATTVYGVSMMQEGVSRVLSLRLPDKPEDEAAQAAAGAA